MLISQLFKKKTVVHIRGGELFTFYNKNNIINIFIVYLLNNADKVIVLGQIEKKILCNRYKIFPYKIHIIPNAINIISPKIKEIKNYEGCIEILFLGRIDSHAGAVETPAHG